MKYLVMAWLLAPWPALACNPVQVHNVTAMLHRGEQAALGSFTDHAECYYWPAFYDAAQLMQRDGRPDEALQWLYAGEIRARVGAGLDPDASRNNALMVALNQGIATPIKAHARRDKDAWLKAIDAALAWDGAHPLKPASALVTGAADVAIDPKNFDLLYAQVREGLQAMRDDIANTSPHALGDSSGAIDFRR